MKRKWVDINDFEGLYRVSNFGEIKSVKRIAKHSRGYMTRPIKEKILKQFKNPSGYCTVTLFKNGKHHVKTVHRIVMDSFTPHNKKEQINHKNLNKHDNRIVNLEWCTRMENVYHAKRNGAYKNGSHHVNAKFTDAQIVLIRLLYKTGKYSHPTLGKIFKVAHSTIGRILRHESYDTIRGMA